MLVKSTQECDGQLKITGSNLKLFVVNVLTINIPEIGPHIS